MVPRRQLHQFLGQASRLRSITVKITDHRGNTQDYRDPVRIVQLLR
jgi:hypothetical protein